MSKPVQICAAAYGFNSTQFGAGAEALVLYVLLDDGRIFRQSAYTAGERELHWTEIEGPWTK